MPYGYRHIGGGWYEVYNKDTGRIMGKTKGKENLRKYLAALHANVKENKRLKETLKDITEENDNIYYIEIQRKEYIDFYDIDEILNRFDVQFDEVIAFMFVDDNDNIDTIVLPDDIIAHQKYYTTIVNNYPMIIIVFQPWTAIK